VPAKAAAGGDSGKEKKAPPVVTVVTTGEMPLLAVDVARNAATILFCGSVYMYIIFISMKRRNR
jgi:hypothetical protein